LQMKSLGRTTPASTTSTAKGNAPFPPVLATSGGNDAELTDDGALIIGPRCISGQRCRLFEITDRSQVAREITDAVPDLHSIGNIVVNGHISGVSNVVQGVHDRSEVDAVGIAKRHKVKPDRAVDPCLDCLLPVFPRSHILQVHVHEPRLERVQRRHSVVLATDQKISRFKNNSEVIPVYFLQHVN